MEKINIQLYTKLNNLEETHNFLATRDDNVIKYIDFENNKVIVDMSKNIMIRENSDYCFTLDFNKNNIIINVKAYQKEFEKLIKTLYIKRLKNSYSIKYQLIDEDIINEYYIKF